MRSRLVFAALASFSFSLLSPRLRAVVRRLAVPLAPFLLQNATRFGVDKIGEAKVRIHAVFAHVLRDGFGLGYTTARQPRVTRRSYVQ